MVPLRRPPTFRQAGCNPFAGSHTRDYLSVYETEQEHQAMVCELASRSPGLAFDHRFLWILPSPSLDPDLATPANRPKNTRVIDLEGKLVCN